MILGDIHRLDVETTEELAGRIRTSETSPAASPTGRSSNGTRCLGEQPAAPGSTRTRLQRVEHRTGQGGRQQLERVLASATFRQVDRLKRFLSFIVLEALAGRGDQLKEYVIGVQVFDKESSFDPRADPIVRVQARRLRARLVRYYREEGGTDALVIELPKGGYAPVFKQREAPAPATPIDRRDARRPEHRSRCCRSRITVAARDSGYFCDGAARRRSIHAWRSSRRCACSPCTGRAAGHRRSGPSTPGRPPWS